MKRFLLYAAIVLAVFGCISQADAKDPEDQEFRHVVVTLKSGEKVEGYLHRGWHAEGALLKQENYSFKITKTPDDKEPVKTADGVTLLSGEDAARAVAQQLNAVLLTNMGTDVSPLSGSKVKGEGLAAALKYIAGFSPDFLAQVKSFSVPSVQALACNLDNGVEVSLGDADDIQKKERIVTKLLEEQKGVTYINVRTPDAYTYRSVDL